ncbi:hypothetical protein CLOSCI_01098 [[Clostridium] scindens ATCC 35704]|nr:hypothetical protein CLOSCI_01098 [[Clostridium] scindens ATCC 35704]
MQRIIYYAVFLSLPYALNMWKLSSAAGFLDLSSSAGMLTSYRFFHTLLL